jgi:hypothetical protein
MDDRFRFRSTRSAIIKRCTVRCALTKKSCVSSFADLTSISSGSFSVDIALFEPLAGARERLKLSTEPRFVSSRGSSGCVDCGIIKKPFSSRSAFFFFKDSCEILNTERKSQSGIVSLVRAFASLERGRVCAARSRAHAHAQSGKGKQKFAKETLRFGLKVKRIVYLNKQAWVDAHRLAALEAEEHFFCAGQIRKKPKLSR